VLEPAPEIVCVDCGGRCFLLSYPPDDNAWRPGDIVAYRCEDCRDRWDIELTDDDSSPESD
jgi:DNA-directed RNA polymerase subunit RPC12/RpoP